MLQEEPLLVPIPTHLFRFQETIFFWTIPQLLADALAGSLLWYIWEHSDLALAARALLCLGSIPLIILLVHVRIQHQSFLTWLLILLRFRAAPAITVKQTPGAVRALQAGHIPGARRHKRYPTTQETWLPLAGISQKTLQVFHPRQAIQAHTLPDGRVAVIEMQGFNWLHVPSTERERFLARFRAFLPKGMSIQLLSTNEYVNWDGSPRKQEQEARLGAIADTWPRLAALGSEIAAFHDQLLPTCLEPHHYLVIRASRSEQASMQPAQRTSLWVFLFTAKQRLRQHTDEDIFRHLQMRVRSLVGELKVLDLHPRLLGDEELAHLCARIQTPGIGVPPLSFARDLAPLQHAFPTAVISHYP